MGPWKLSFQSPTTLGFACSRLETALTLTNLPTLLLYLPLPPSGKMEKDLSHIGSWAAKVPLFEVVAS